uniref:RING-type E3 ubiquitin transferase n=7 Tax=Triticinae TaxID=1648030 RepID=A0A453BM20_AEGTS
QRRTIPHGVAVFIREARILGIARGRQRSISAVDSVLDRLSKQRGREGGMDEKAAKMEKLSSAAAFVEGGVQDACDDACSICLEAFCDSDPSTVTSCKHDFHLQCILEWCQRSSQCPMCWQAISMKDPLSQELLEAVEQEKNVQADRSRTTAIFRHPMLGHFEVPVDTDDAELEERLMQHLAAAAVTRRSHRHGRREGHRGRSGPHGRTQIVVFSTTETTSSDPISSDSPQVGDSEYSPAIISAPVDAMEEASANILVHNNTSSNCPVGSNDRISGDEASPINQDGAGPSDPQSFSNTLKTRLQSVSVKYKDSITKNTRGWKERWLSRSDTISSLGSDVRREVNAGIAAVSRMMERLETRDGSGSGPSSASSDNVSSATDNQGAASSNFCASVNGASSSATCASRSGSQ